MYGYSSASLSVSWMNRFPDEPDWSERTCYFNFEKLYTTEFHFDPSIVVFFDY